MPRQVSPGQHAGVVFAEDFQFVFVRETRINDPAELRPRVAYGGVGTKKHTSGADLVNQPSSGICCATLPQKSPSAEPR